VSDNDMGEILAALAVTRRFLTQRYWPRLLMLARQQGPARARPYTQLPQALTSGIGERDAEQWLHEALQAQPSPHDPHPTLSQRRDGIGLQRLPLPHYDAPPATTTYLPDTYAATVQALDEQWCHAHTPADRAPTTRPESVQVQARPKTDANELWEKAKRVEREQGRRAALPLLKAVLAHDPGHCKALYAVGRMLLAQDDAEGLKYLNKAMTVHPACTRSACTHIAEFLEQRGQHEHARRYRDRARAVA
jgi:hypothetical protein